MTWADASCAPRRHTLLRAAANRRTLASDAGETCSKTRISIREASPRLLYTSDHAKQSFTASTRHEDTTSKRARKQELQRKCLCASCASLVRAHSSRATANASTRATSLEHNPLHSKTIQLPSKTGKLAHKHELQRKCLC